MFLTSKKIGLRGIIESDLASYAAWLEDSEVTFFLEMGDRPQRQKEVDEFWYTADRDDAAVVFAIIDNATDQFIGVCGLYQISRVHRRSQLNILIGKKEFWSKGCGQEACSLLLDYAFKTLNLNSVQLGVNSENMRAVRAYEKAGFVFEGKRRSFVYRNGKYYDTSLYSVLRSEYLGFV
jgi:RimJ/RimL family protein N-acetyltransferase